MSSFFSILSEHFIYNSFSHYCAVPFEILRYSLAQIYLHSLQGPFYKKSFVPYDIPTKELEYDEAVSIFIFSIFPPIDGHLLETKGHLIHIYYSSL